MRFLHEKNRVYVEDEGDKLIAEVTFPQREDGVMEINHTFVAPILRGKGIAAELMKEACQEIRKQEKKAEATCPYAVKWFEEHEAEQDILVKK